MNGAMGERCGDRVPASQGSKYCILLFGLSVEIQSGFIGVGGAGVLRGPLMTLARSLPLVK